MRATCLIGLLMFCPSWTQAADPVRARLDDTQRAFVNDYCVRCHNVTKQRGKLQVDNISFLIDSLEQAERWQKILNQLNAGEMPPEGARQPARERKAKFLDALSHTLVTARKIIGDQGGRIAMQRLNQREYQNTIHDLLGAEVDVRTLPADGGTGTFDTVGTSLFMSSDQVEQYLALGRRALDECFARASARLQQPFRARTEAEIIANREMNGVFKRTKVYEQCTDRGRRRLTSLELNDSAD
jgi:cytochrome c553